MNTLKVQVGQTRMVAHRGCSYLEKENTMAAFIAAGNRSYFGIETDIHRTADGQYIVIHDGTLARVGADQLEVDKSSFATLRKVTLRDIDGTLGREDLHLPTLYEYIGACKRYEKHGFLEIKGDFTVEWMDEVMTQIYEQDYAEHITVISFSYTSICNLRVHHPDQPAMYLCTSANEALLDRLPKDGFGLDIYFRVVDQALVDECNKRGIELNVWTVDGQEDCERLAAMGVSYITSNRCEAAEAREA